MFQPFRSQHRLLGISFQIEMAARPCVEDAGKHPYPITRRYQVVWPGGETSQIVTELHPFLAHEPIRACIEEGAFLRGLKPGPYFVAFAARLKSCPFKT